MTESRREATRLGERSASWALANEDAGPHPPDNQKVKRGVNRCLALATPARQR